MNNIRKNNIFSILFFTSLVLLMTFCKAKKGVVRETTSNNQDSKIVVPQMFRLYKIDSLNNVYLIYAYNGSRPFKLVSLKDENNGSCEKLEVNKSYQLMISSIVLKKLNGRDVSPSVTPLLTGVEYYGNIISFEKDSILDIFTSPNIRGLCYSRPFRM